MIKNSFYIVILCVTIAQNFKFASKAERDTFVNAPLSVWINSQFDTRYAVNADWRKKAHEDCDGYVYDNDNSEYHCVATIEL